MNDSGALNYFAMAIIYFNNNTCAISQQSQFFWIFVCIM